MTALLHARVLVSGHDPWSPLVTWLKRCFVIKECVVRPVKYLFVVYASQIEKHVFFVELGGSH